MESISLAVASAPDMFEHPTISPAPTSVNESGAFLLPAFEEAFGVAGCLASGSWAGVFRAPITISSEQERTLQASLPNLRSGPIAVSAPPEFRPASRIPRNAERIAAIQP